MFAKSSGLLFIAALCTASVAALAQPASMEDRLIARGAVADVTPQQRYRTAINEAGGGYKVYLEECAALAVPGRAVCRSEAKKFFDRDMAAARQILRSK